MAPGGAIELKHLNPSPRKVPNDSLVFQRLGFSSSRNPKKKELFFPFRILYKQLEIGQSAVLYIVLEA